MHRKGQSCENDHPLRKLLLRIPKCHSRLLLDDKTLFQMIRVSIRRIWYTERKRVAFRSEACGGSEDA